MAQAFAQNPPILDPLTFAIIAGARPNFIKAAPLYRALAAYTGVDVRVLHTGQHREAGMSGVFFRELGLPEPWVVLDGRCPTIPRETARILAGLEAPLNTLRPDWVIVIGDITSTLAGALAAKQSGLRVAHVEAGLRSHDRSMPEELNRVAVDHMADLLFASEAIACENLRREGIEPDRIHFSGNILIDALEAVLPVARKLTRAGILESLDAGSAATAAAGPFALFTFHRPSNVDDRDGLLRVIRMAEQTAGRLPVYFPLHPRTVRQLDQLQLMGKLTQNPAIHVLPPLNYSAMVGLMRLATFVLTDSGGVQEETTYLGTPCLTFRSTTERPATIIYGTNTLIADRNPATAMTQIELILAGQYKSGQVPPLWDGQAARRIAAVLLNQT